MMTSQTAFRFRVCFLASLLLLAISPMVSSTTWALPSTMVYEGQLLDSDGQAKTTEHQLRFSLWSSADWQADSELEDGSIDSSAAGYLGWQEVHLVTPSEQGYFAVVIGEDSAFPALQDQAPVFFQIEVKTAAEADTAYELLDPTADSGADELDRQAVGTVFYSQSAEVSLVSEVSESLPIFSDQDTYQAGEVVIYQTQLYQAQENIFVGAFDESQWQMIGPDITQKQDQIFDYLVEDAAELLAIESPNAGETAFQQSEASVWEYDGTEWAEVSTKAAQWEFVQRFGVKPYSNSLTYRANELVSYNGVLYRANQEIGVSGADGSVETAAGDFAAEAWDAIVTIDGLQAIAAWEVTANTPLIPEATAENQGFYYIVTEAGDSALSGETESYEIGDWLINLDGSSWTRVPNNRAIASQEMAQAVISLLNNDGTEITDGSVNNTQIMTPLRGLQQLLANRLSSLFSLRDETDETKQLSFDLSQLAADTNRVITVPDEDITLVDEGRIGIKAFSETETYLLGELVLQEGVVYRSLEPVLVPAAFDPDQWETVVRGSQTFRGEFSAENSYQAGDVLWGQNNQLYRVAADFSPEAGQLITDSSVQENLQLIGASSGGSLSYDSTVSYAVGDIIAVDGELYINTLATEGSVSAPEILNLTKWENWRVNTHSVVADEDALLALDPAVNDTAYREDNQQLYRYVATDGSNDELGDWGVLYDLSQKQDQIFDYLVDDAAELLTIESPNAGETAFQQSDASVWEYDGAEWAEVSTKAAQWEFVQRFGVKPYASNSTYRSNELVSYNGVLYRANQAIGASAEDGSVETPAGAFDSTAWDTIVNVDGLKPIGAWEVTSNTPLIPEATAENQGFYYIVTQGGDSALSGETEVYEIGDWLVNLDGSSWTRLPNNREIASQEMAQAVISLLNDDGTEITSGSVDNTQIMTPLRGLQQLLANRLSSLFSLRDEADETKQLSFNLSELSANTSRLITVPDEDITLVDAGRIGAKEYDSTATYINNQIVNYDYAIWRNIVAIETPEEFDSSKWELFSRLDRPWQTMSGSFSAEVFHKYLLDSSTGSFTVTLPASPSEGDRIELTDVADFSVNPVTIDFNGTTLYGTAQNIVLDQADTTLEFTYRGGTWGMDFYVHQDF